MSFYGGILLESLPAKRLLRRICDCDSYGSCSLREFFSPLERTFGIDHVVLLKSCAVSCTLHYWAELCIVVALIGSSMAGIHCLLVTMRGKVSMVTYSPIVRQ